MGENRVMAAQAGVVIIDDSANWRRRLEEVVDDVAGLTVIGTAASPAAALELIDRLHPPILILDLSLTGGTGIDVLKAMARLDVHSRVVVVTGSPSAEIKARCLALGARYFFDKAFDSAELETALQALAEEAAAH